MVLEVDATGSWMYSEFHGYYNHFRYRAGLLGFLGILVQFLLKQNSQRRDDHVAALGAIHEQGIRIQKLHTATLELIQETALATRQHADKLHREAMDAIAAQGTRMQELHTEAMDAITALDREHREKLHTETMTQIAALRTCADR